MIPPVILPALSLGGTALFALTGALLAARLGQTFVTMGFFALLTGVGGGSLRDMLLGVPVFWLTDPWTAPVILITAIIAWLTPKEWWEGEMLEWGDAAGLSAFAVLGTAKGLSYDIALMPAIVLGIVTGCAGGIIRDVIAGVPSILMRPELYVTAAALAATAAALGAAFLPGLGVPLPAVWAGAWLAGFALRGAAIHWQLALPGYRASGETTERQ